MKSEITKIKKEGWASTNPGQTKYHYYEAGSSLCNYGRKPSELTFLDTEEEPALACSSCALHREKAAKAAKRGKDPRHNHPDKTWDEMSTWQRKQYATPAGLATLAPAAPAPGLFDKPKTTLGVMAATRVLKQEEEKRKEQAVAYHKEQAKQQAQAQADRVDTHHGHFWCAQKVRIFAAAGRKPSIEQLEKWQALDEQRTAPKAVAPAEPVAPVAAAPTTIVYPPASELRPGDVIFYKLPGRVCTTFQKAIEVRECGDVLTEMDGWILAGNYTCQVKITPTMRQKSPKDNVLWAAGLPWYYLGHAPAKQVPTELAPEQVGNPKLRIKREAERAARRLAEHEAAVAALPPMFYEEPAAPAGPRYTTEEEANQHKLNILVDFTTNRRQHHAERLLKVRNYLAGLDAEEVGYLHSIWQARQWGCALEYLADFLWQQAKSRKHRALKAQMLRMKADLLRVEIVPQAVAQEVPEVVPEVIPQLVPEEPVYMRIAA